MPGPAGGPGEEFGGAEILEADRKALREEGDYLCSQCGETVVETEGEPCALCVDECEACGGSGFSDEDESADCECCNGDGWTLREDEDDHDAPASEDSRCRSCGDLAGASAKADNTCSRCGSKDWQDPKPLQPIESMGLTPVPQPVVPDVAQRDIKPQNETSEARLRVRADRFTALKPAASRADRGPCALECGKPVLKGEVRRGDKHESVHEECYQRTRAVTGGAA
jgi:hypothetical protein